MVGLHRWVYTWWVYTGGFTPDKLAGPYGIFVVSPKVFDIEQFKDHFNLALKPKDVLQLRRINHYSEFMQPNLYFL